MTLYAHIETGVALDIQPGDNDFPYLKRFPGVDTSAWQVVEVSGDVQPGAKISGGAYYNPDGSIVQKDGTFTPAPQPQPVPPPLAKPIGMNDLTAWLQAIAQKLGVTLPPITGT